MPARALTRTWFNVTGERPDEGDLLILSSDEDDVCAFQNVDVLPSGEIFVEGNLFSPHQMVRVWSTLPRSTPCSWCGGDLVRGIPHVTMSADGLIWRSGYPHVQYQVWTNTGTAKERYPNQEKGFSYSRWRITPLFSPRKGVLYAPADGKLRKKIHARDPWDALEVLATASFGVWHTCLFGPEPEGGVGQ
jgi:hypothetical protein